MPAKIKRERGIWAIVAATGLNTVYYIRPLDTFIPITLQQLQLFLQACMWNVMCIVRVCEYKRHNIFHLGAQQQNILLPKLQVKIIIVQL